MIGADAMRAEMVVTDEEFRKFLTTLGALLPDQLVALDAAIKARRDVRPVPPAEPEIETPPPADECATIADIETHFAAAPICPQCGSDRVGKWGPANRLKRYRCTACKATFNALTGTSLAHLHKRELWGAHAQALVDGISLRKVADRLGVHLETAFNWRHRFLKAPKSVKPKELEGTVEADETYFLH